MRIEAWTQAIIADVKLRDLTQLVPLLGGLVQATQTLRVADWNESADRDDQENVIVTKESD